MTPRGSPSRLQGVNTSFTGHSIHEEDHGNGANIDNLKHPTAAA
jgi:hypothetical protein